MPKHLLRTSGVLLTLMISGYSLFNAALADSNALEPQSVKYDPALKMADDWVNYNKTVKEIYASKLNGFPVRFKTKPMLLAFINRQGEVEKVVILKHSEQPNQDNILVEKIKEMSPFPPLPISSKRNSQDITFFAPTGTSEPLINKDSSQNVDFTHYIPALEKRIKSRWEPISRSSLWKTICCLYVDKQGNLLYQFIVESNAPLNEQVRSQKAIEEASPFEPLPKEFAGESIRVEFTFEESVRQGSFLKRLFH